MTRNVVVVSAITFDVGVSQNRGSFVGCVGQEIKMSPGKGRVIAFAEAYHHFSESMKVPCGKKKKTSLNKVPSLGLQQCFAEMQSML